MQIVRLVGVVRCDITHCRWFIKLDQWRDAKVFVQHLIRLASDESLMNFVREKAWQGEASHSCNNQNKSACLPLSFPTASAAGICTN